MAPTWTVAKAVHNARREQKMSQTALAEKMQAETGEPWNQAKVSRIETGEQEPTWGEVLAFAAVQGLPLTWYRYGFQGPEVTPESLRSKLRIARNAWSRGFRPSFSFA